MPEIKHNFTAGKMNKDADERLVRNGEYRHAVNVQVRTTDQGGDGGAAGVVQNIKGTKNIGQSYFKNWMSDTAPTTESEYLNYGNSQYPRCIASIADEKNDKSYFFFASSMTSPINTADAGNVIDNPDLHERVYIDCILQQDQNNVTRPVVIDQFAYVNTLASVNPDAIDNPGFNLFGNAWDAFYISNPSKAKYFRVGMEIRFLTPDGVNLLEKPAIIKAKSPNPAPGAGNLSTTILLQEFQPAINLDNIAAEQNFDPQQIYIVATAPRVLNFTPLSPMPTSQMVAPLPHTITGVNIIDNLLFWTDSYSEPKKINIDRCIAGTNINDWIHTKLFVKSKEGDLVDAASISHQLDSGNIGDSGLQQWGSGVNSDLKEEHITVIKKAPTAPPTLEMNSNSRSGQTIVSITHQFINNVTSSMISIGQEVDITDSALLYTSFRSGDLVEVIRNDSAQDSILRFTATFITYLTASGNSTVESTDKIRIRLLTTASVEADDTEWIIQLEQPKPIFELKLVRFGYRYKYEDGEYSTFSPWSEIAFKPRKFEYTSGEAYNLGMINDVRDLAIKDFIPYTIPLDVKEVDILYKTTDDANVYVVDTIKKGLSSEWELFTPDGDVDTVEIKTGYLNITSEMIHNVLPENQLFRAWDNVPRYALAQEITGNRLIYGNYTQGYNINENVGLRQLVKSDSVDISEKPKKSIKSIRDYKVGMVFGDKYGRETPVISSSYTTLDNSDDGYTSLTGNISLPKTLCNKANSFIITQIWGDPNVEAIPPLAYNDGWIDYVKYYIKETSNEYYNLVMDRSYESGDHGTVWISFNSADRNKVDEETYLIQKNKHGTNDPILEEARYKIIAIENEAPDYIKTNNVELGRIRDLTGTETYDTMFSDSGDVPESDIPENLYSDAKVSIAKTYWQASVVGGDSQDGTDSPVFGREPKGRLKFRVIGRGSTTGVELKSQWRYVSHYTYGELEGGTGEEVMTMHWDKKFVSSDVDMYNRFINLFNAGDANYAVANLLYDFEFVEEVIENKPEFDGKFFVKIKRDVAATKNIAIPMGDPGFETKSTHQLHYIEAKEWNQHEMATPPTDITYNADFSSGDWFGGAFADFINGGGNDNLFDNASFYLDYSGNAMADSTGAYMTDESSGTAYDLISFYFEDTYGTDLATESDVVYIEPGLPNLLTSYNSDLDEWTAADNFDIMGNPDSDGSSLTNLYPVPFTGQNTETSFSPFGSCSENYNDMTRVFWRDIYTSYATVANGYTNGKIPTQLNGNVDPTVAETSVSTGVVFLDAVNMARMKILPGPHADTSIDPGSSDGEPYSTGPYGLSEGGPSDTNFDKYWKPLNVFHKGEAKVNGLALIADDTVGSMCLSYSGGWDQGATPSFFNEMATQGTYFRFDSDPTQTTYRVVGVLRASQSWGEENENYQYNWRGNDKPTGDVNIPPKFDFGSSTMGNFDWNDGNPETMDAAVEEALDDWPYMQPDGIVNGIEMANCDIYPGEDTAVDNKCLHRHTMWVEFRKVDDANPTATLNVGMNLSDFDPRAFLHHDGRDSMSVTILNFVPNVATNDHGEETEVELGACWETEPKEDIGVDIYYEASSAIPMVLTKENAFNFAPINSKVKAKRTNAQSGVTKEIKFKNTYKDHKVSNIHFSGNITDQAIITITSKDVNGNIGLHKGDFAIGDELLFEHSNGTVTSAIIKNYWSPVVPNYPPMGDDVVYYDAAGNELGDDGFYAFTDNDLQYGVVSGPKGFQMSEGTADNILIGLSEGGSLTTFQSSFVTAGMELIAVIIEPAGGGNAVSYVPPFPIFVNSVQDNDNLLLGSTILMEGEDGYLLQNSNWLYTLGAQNGDIIIFTLLAPTGYYGIDINVYDRPIQLAWHNCWSFGNGVESDRIRDDFNAPQLDNGVKASTTLSNYGEENIPSGIIYSGLYNSTSQVNNLNEFNQAEKITKELNPSYGAIQRLKTRDTDVVVFTEDKVLKVLSSKDALYNADGNPQLTATGRVLGQAIPFTGDYGISNNPESLAVDQYRMYFTDRQRGTVMRLSQDGLTPISSIGMRSWFRDRLKYTKNLIGSWDPVSREYNLTLIYPNSNSYSNETLSFSEDAKGWVSFKSFVLSQGVSISGKYITTRDHKIYEHHADFSMSQVQVDRNTFHDEELVPSQVHLLLNDMPSSVKSYMTINYEGSKARKTKHTPETMGAAQMMYTGEIQFDGNGNPLQSSTVPINVMNQWGNIDEWGGYKNLFSTPGWYCDSISTDLQNGTVRDFKNKEGKWFASIKGVSDTQTATTTMLDTTEFNIQGIGQIVQDASYNGVEPCENCEDGEDDNLGCPDGFTLMGDGSCVESVVYGCMDSAACNYDSDATFNMEALCIYNCAGCMDPFDPNYDSQANISDTTYCQGYVNGCMDDGQQTWSPQPGVQALNYNPLATQSGYLITISGAQYGLPDTYIWNQTIWPNGTYTENPPPCASAPEYYYGCCSYPTIIDNIDDEVPNEDSDPDVTFIEACVNSGGLAYVWSGTTYCVGCTQVGNDNYNPNATVDCADIDWLECDDEGGTCVCCKDATTDTGIGCTDFEACNYDENATLGCVNNTCCNYDCYCCSDPNADNYNNLAGTYTPLDEPHPDCVFFSIDQPYPCVEGWGPGGSTQYGCTDNAANNYVGDAAVAGGMLPCPEGTCDDLYDNSWCPCCTYDDDEIEIPEDPEEDELVGCTDPTMFNYCEACTQSCASNFNPEATCCVPFIYGCTDNGMFNYDPDANTDDGSCVEYIFGCTDSSADNWQIGANTDDGSCQYGDDAVWGCTDVTAFNYDPEATDNDGSCDPRICGCMDSTPGNNPDVNGNGGYAALNYNPDANTIYMFLYEYQIAGGVNNINDPNIDTSICPESICEYPPDTNLTLHVDALDGDYGDDWPEIDPSEFPWPNFQP